MHIPQLRLELQENISQVRQDVAQYGVKTDLLWKLVELEIPKLLIQKTHPRLKALLPKLVEGTITREELQELEILRATLLLAPEPVPGYHALLAMLQPAIHFRMLTMDSHNAGIPNNSARDRKFLDAIWDRIRLR
jgi:hypothetical protein